MWSNARDPRDVNDDLLVVPLDVILVINELNAPRYEDANGRLQLPPPLVCRPPTMM